MLLVFLGSMILAGIIEAVLWYLAIRFFEWRFLRKAQLICFLYDSIYIYLENNFKDDNPIQISVEYKSGKSKIKFHNISEARLKIELLIYRAMKYYKIAKFLDETENSTEKFEIDEAKEFLEEMCQEMKNLVSQREQESKKQGL